MYVEVRFAGTAKEGREKWNARMQSVYALYNVHRVDITFPKSTLRLYTTRELGNAKVDGRKKKDGARDEEGCGGGPLKSSHVDVLEITKSVTDFPLPRKIKLRFSTSVDISLRAFHDVQRERKGRCSSNENARG